MTFVHEDSSGSDSGGGTAYPARLNIDYNGEGRDRLTVFFRILMVIPIALVAGGFSTGYYDYGSIGVGDADIDSLMFAGGTIGGLSLIIFSVLLMIVFRQKYPRWWFDFNLEVTRFSARIGAYIGLLTDRYPSTDEEQGVHIEIDYPDAASLNRWLPLVKWFLAIPHYVALILLGIVAIVVVIVSWFAILFTGTFPRGFHDFLVGVSRWSLRVEAYAFLMATDEYPPFSLD